MQSYSHKYIQLISDATESRFSLFPRVTLLFFQAPLQDFPTFLSKFSSFFCQVCFERTYSNRERLRQEPR